MEAGTLVAVRAGGEGWGAGTAKLGREEATVSLQGGDRTSREPEGRQQKSCRWLKESSAST